MTNKLIGRLQLDFGDWTDVGAGRIAITLGDIIWDGTLIKKGFMSDGSSTPWIVWWFLPPWGDITTWGAIIHDYFCQMLDQGTPCIGGETRELCDLQYRLVLKEVRVSPLKAWVCWKFVRIASVIREYSLASNRRLQAFL